MFQCTGTCANGWQRRQVDCKTYEGRQSDKCDADSTQSVQFPPICVLSTITSLLLLLLVRLHDQSSSSDEVGGLLQVLQAPIYFLVKRSYWWRWTRWGKERFLVSCACVRWACCGRNAVVPKPPDRACQEGGMHLLLSGFQRWFDDGGLFLVMDGGWWLLFLCSAFG